MSLFLGWGPELLVHSSQHHDSRYSGPSTSLGDEWWKQMLAVKEAENNWFAEWSQPPWEVPFFECNFLVSLSHVQHLHSKQRNKSRVKSYWSPRQLSARIDFSAVHVGLGVWAEHAGLMDPLFLVLPVEDFRPVNAPTKPFACSPWLTGRPQFLWSPLNVSYFECYFDFFLKLYTYQVLGIFVLSSECSY